jgi:thymidine kinase
MTGRIEVIWGPMFAGKTTELLRRFERHVLAGQNVLLVKHRSDCRYDAHKVVAHGGAEAPAVVAATLAEVAEAAAVVDFIGIDEGQFFPDVYEWCVVWADQGKTVIVAALDTYATRAPWHPIPALAATAETTTKLAAVCDACKGDAAFTFRVAPEGPTVDVGGKDKYLPLCRACHLSRRARGASADGKNEAHAT